MTVREIRERLFALQDAAYKEFNCKLLPTVDPKTVIGVRAPELRKLAKELSRSGDTADFMAELPHTYYEENNLHGFFIEQMKDYDGCIAAVDAFLPYVDNWGVCDSVTPKIFKKHLPELLQKIDEWLESGQPYTIRFAIRMLMNFYLDEAFETAYPERVAAVRSEEYYVNMMIAWYFATALAKQYETVLPYIEGKCLARWTHNKAIQKAVESYRIAPEQKTYLKTLKI